MTTKMVVITLIVVSLVQLAVLAMIILNWSETHNAPTQSYFKKRKLYYVVPGYCTTNEGEYKYYNAEDIIRAYSLDLDLCLIQGSKDYLCYPGDVMMLEHLTAQDAYNMEV